MSAVEPLHPLAGLMPAPLPGPDPLRLGLPRRELVQVTARHGADPTGLGFALPGPGESAETAGITALWMQPRGWLLSAPWDGEGALLTRAAPLAPAAALVDQSHGRCTIRLAGAKSRAVLAKLCRIDLHPRIFGPGRVAATQVAHLACLLHQAEPEAFELIVFSTLAANLLDALASAAAEYGYAPG
ncbi:hypothetical protein JMJ55_02965 [Belnapia sp. T6]|uniref:Sarcosine oxidase subunit gamma n=1 Tax=Belnapia mucosa TaxID=2804532 RepID=A0ABS1UXS7_9PROT|nr:sarcosine oxidase subunit gamma family protein [Belnapia mucosa]MBL6454269.1 hypothetical protein [Belnapia mucosa]